MCNSAERFDDVKLLGLRFQNDLSQNTYSNFSLTDFFWPSHFSLFNTTGQVIRSGTITQETVRLSLNELAAGLYKMVIEDEQGNRATKNRVKQ
jgi:uncharacterized protein (DUF2141 family)